MKTEVKEASFVINTKARLSTLDTNVLSYETNEMTMDFLLEDYGKMSFSFRNIPKYEELSRRHFPYTCIRRPIMVSLEFPLITEAELQVEAERKQQINDLKADIKSMESRLKRLEAADNIGKRYGY